MAPHDLTGDWHVRVFRPRLPWGANLPRAAEVGDALRDMMLAKGNALEDAAYLRVVPNEYMIEIQEANYLRNFQPIEERLKGQWRTKLLEQLSTANSRQGRNVYHLGAPLRLEIRPAEDLGSTEIRIYCRVNSRGPEYPGDGEPERWSTQAGSTMEGRPCLELVPGGRRWILETGITTIGRHDACEIYLDLPSVQEKRLISGEHAYLLFKWGAYYLHDGSPEGRASVNGTFVNGQPVRQDGRRLQDGDTITLAALDPADPRPDVPGVVVLRYREGCA